MIQYDLPDAESVPQPTTLMMWLMPWSADDNDDDDDEVTTTTMTTTDEDSDEAEDEEGGCQARHQQHPSTPPTHARTWSWVSLMMPPV